MSLTVEAAVNEFISRVVAGDLDDACELVSSDVEYDNVPIGKNHGPEAMKTFLSSMSGFDEVQFVVHRQTVTGNIVMNERSDRFRSGEKWIDLPVAGIFEVNADGKISLWRDYFDVATFTTQKAALSAG
jgi:limonene-1,2-epoxide hydrolase